MCFGEIRCFYGYKDTTNFVNTQALWEKQTLWEKTARALRKKKSTPTYEKHTGCLAIDQVACMRTSQLRCCGFYLVLTIVRLICALYASRCLRYNLFLRYGTPLFREIEMVNHLHTCIHITQLIHISIRSRHHRCRSLGIARRRSYIDKALIGRFALESTHYTIVGIRTQTESIRHKHWQKE